MRWGRKETGDEKRSMGICRERRRGKREKERVKMKGDVDRKGEREGERRGEDDWGNSRERRERKENEIGDEGK